MSSVPEIKPWDLKWEPEQVKRFWDWWGSNPAMEGRYFSKNNGASIISHVRKYTGLRGTVIDLGAGPGFLVDLLLKRGVRTLAFDQSPASIELLKKKYIGNPAFLDARVSTAASIPATDGEGDTVMFIETVEHLDDTTLDGVLREARRILKRGGRIFVTTPNDENLDYQKLMCPSCGCLFHMFQHMRTWSAATLDAKMAEYGFQKVVCRPTLFTFMPWYARWIHRLAYKVLGKRLPHLVYVGEAV
jgi:2-polyprenyl-3-methyl-5-hydroxy-6-metoxy-1,4-benzoquinol methylase